MYVKQAYAFHSNESILLSSLLTPPQKSQIWKYRNPPDELRPDLYQRSPKGKACFETHNLASSDTRRLPSTYLMQRARNGAVLLQDKHQILVLVYIYKAFLNVIDWDGFFQYQCHALAPVSYNAFILDMIKSDRINIFLGFHMSQRVLCTREPGDGPLHGPSSSTVGGGNQPINTVGARVHFHPYYSTFRQQTLLNNSKPNTVQSLPKVDSEAGRLGLPHQVCGRGSLAKCDQ